MKIPLVYDENNPKYRLLSSIFKIMDSRKIKQELSRNGFTRLNSVIKAMKIKLISRFFDSNSKYIVNEINNSLELRKRWNIKSILDYKKNFQAYIRIE
jgi:Mg/Co/Ni transporter MgtE